MIQIQVATEALQLLTSGEAQEYRLLPFALKGHILCCYGEAGRNYESVLTETEVLTGRTIEVVPLEVSEFTRLLGHYYRTDGRGHMTVRFSTQGERGFLHGLIDEAHREHASDIHLEAYEDRCRIRFRIDGKLLERHVLGKGNYASLVNQIKILANLDISEKRLPQDGRILHDGVGNRFDIRVSFLPTIVN